MLPINPRVELEEEEEGKEGQAEGIWEDHEEEEENYN